MLKLNSKLFKQPSDETTIKPGLSERIVFVFCYCVFVRFLLTRLSGVNRSPTAELQELFAILYGVQFSFQWEVIRSFMTSTLSIFYRTQRKLADSRYRGAADDDDNDMDWRSVCSLCAQLRGAHSFGASMTSHLFESMWRVWACSGREVRRINCHIEIVFSVVTGNNAATQRATATAVKLCSHECYAHTNACYADKSLSLSRCSPVQHNVSRRFWCTTNARTFFPQTCFCWH